CPFRACLHSLLRGLDVLICVVLLAAVVRVSEGRKLDLSFRVLLYDVTWNTLVCVRSFGVAGLVRLRFNFVFLCVRFRYLRDYRPAAGARQMYALLFRAIYTVSICAGVRR